VHSSAQRRKSAVDYGWRRRRLAAVLAGIVVLGGMFAVTQFASAADDKARAACEDAVKAQREEVQTKKRQQEEQQKEEQGRENEQPPGDVPPPEEQPPAEQPPAEQPPAEQPPAEQPPAEQPPGEQQPAPDDTPTDEVTPPAEPEQPLPPECEDVPDEDKPEPPANNGLDVIARDCEKTKLDKHNGFQDGPRCVTTEMGEVSQQDKNPTLLITSAPTRVKKNTPFRLKISTRNLVRDRFLAAGVGGYYLENSVLTEQGLQRGHFHVSCRMLSSNRNAPKPEPVPAFFKAVEDQKGGSRPDTVTVEIPGLPQTGKAQCAAWAGDGSHRIPMMQRANQQPAFDVVRIDVTRR